MRTALLIFIPRKGPFQVLLGPEVTIDKQIAEFKKLAAVRENKSLSELQLWVSDAGITKRMKFRDPKVEAKANAGADAAAKAEAERVAAEQKAKEEQLAKEKADQDAKEKSELEAAEKDRQEKEKAAAAAGAGNKNSRAGGKPEKPKQ